MLEMEKEDNDDMLVCTKSKTQKKNPNLKQQQQKNPPRFKLSCTCLSEKTAIKQD